jgi:2,5-diketo-D-gluconate reductase A
MDINSTIQIASGNAIPVLGLGTWQLTDGTTDAVVSALGFGYRLIDTSGDYGTQPGIGEAIKRAGTPRDQLFITTKVEETDNAYQAVRKNLSELKQDYADLILIHRPPRTGAGEELWHGLISAKREGLAKDIGVSNYSIGQIETLVEVTGETPVVNQLEWSPFGHNLNMLEFCQDNGIAIQAYSPLTRRTRLSDETLQEIATAYHKTPAQVLIRWNLQLDTIPLPKANQRRHQQENIDVFDFSINPDDMAALNGLNEEYSSLGTLPYV